MRSTTPARRRRSRAFVGVRPRLPATSTWRRARASAPGGAARRATALVGPDAVPARAGPSRPRAPGVRVLLSAAVAAGAPCRCGRRRAGVDAVTPGAGRTGSRRPTTLGTAAVSACCAGGCASARQRGRRAAGRPSWSCGRPPEHSRAARGAPPAQARRAGATGAGSRSNLRSHGARPVPVCRQPPPVSSATSSGERLAAGERPLAAAALVPEVGGAGDHRATLVGAGVEVARDRAASWSLMRHSSRPPASALASERSAGGAGRSGTGAAEVAGRGFGFGPAARRTGSCGSVARGAGCVSCAVHSCASAAAQGCGSATAQGCASAPRRQSVSRAVAPRPSAAASSAARTTGDMPSSPRGAGEAAAARAGAGVAAGSSGNSSHELRAAGPGGPRGRRPPAGSGRPRTSTAQQHRGGPSEASHRISTGVPTGIRRASLRMSALRNRTQPWETRPGSRSGRSVP